MAQRLRYFFSIIGLFWLLLTLARMGFWLGLSPVDVSVDGDTLATLWVGLRFDMRLATIIALTTVPFIALPKFNASTYPAIRGALRVWVALVATVLIGVLIVDAGHFQYLQKRLDASALRFLADWKIAGSMVWQSYPVLPIALGWILAVALMDYLHRRFLLPLLDGALQKPKPLWILLRAVLLVAVVLLLLMQRWGTVPLRWNHAYFTGDAQMAQLGLNPVNTFYDSLGFEPAPLDDAAYAPRFKQVARWLGADPQGMDGPFLQREVVPPRSAISKAGANPNVVVVMLESLGASRLGILGNPLKPTPNLDALAADAWHFERFFVPAVSTAKSMFASITGIPDVSRNRTASRNPLITGQRSVINHLKSHRKRYYLGGSAGWANIGALVNNSIDEVTLRQEGDWQAKAVDVWGISDLDLIRESVADLSELPRDEPFFAVIQTAANHRPYTIPEDNEGFVVKSQSQAQIDEAGFVNEAQYNAVRLLDHNVGLLIQAFKDHALYDNTIFVFFGDHQGSHKAAEFMPPFVDDLGLGSHHAVALIHAPAWVSPRQDPQFTSLLDLMPTVVGLFGSPYVNTTLGRDMSQNWPLDQQVVYIDQDGDPMAIRPGEAAVVEAQSQRARYYTWRQGQPPKAMDQASGDLQWLSDMAIAQQQSAERLFTRNKKISAKTEP